MAILNWRYSEDDFEVLPTFNVVLSAYTTTQARLKQYENLYELVAQAIYYNTDSLVYVDKEGIHIVPTGEYLGQITNVL